MRDPVQLVCLPGLSTKETIDEFSGRGIGMDAMAQVCATLGGTIEIVSRPMPAREWSSHFQDQELIFDGRTVLLEAA